MPNWLWEYNLPLFISNRRLIRQKSYKPANTTWALDSGGFSELSLYGEWLTSKETYLESIKRYHETIGNLDWAAPQDWMCEPFIIKKTKSTIPKHQERTIDSFIFLSSDSPVPIIPIIQGFTMKDYLNHVAMYKKRGIDLTTYPTVGIGSVCRRQGTNEVSSILKTLSFLNLHGFGVKKQGLLNAAKCLTSADSMAWSFNARYDQPMDGCTHKNCSNCVKYATRWYNEIQSLLTEHQSLTS